MELTASARKRGLMVMLVSTFLMWGGFFMVVPLISVHYVDGLGWAAAAIGIVLAVRQLTQQGLAVFGGVLSDRFGPKKLICGGLVIRAIGFAAMAWAYSFPLLMLAAILAALGGALFEAPRSAAIAALTNESNRARFYSLTGVVGGLGMTLGPLLGAVLLRVDFSFVCLAAAASFFLNFVVTLLLLPNVRGTADGQRLTAGLSLALHDRPFIAFTVLLIGFWFLWSQLTIALPLAATSMTGSTDSVGVLYALNSSLIVVLQYPLLRILERWLRPLTILCIGMAVMTTGLAAVAAATTLPTLLVCVGIFSVGGMLVSPTMQTVTAELAIPSAVGAYFGVNMLSLALGGGLGNSVGGWMYGFSHELGWPQLPWLVCGLVGAVATIGLTLLAWARRRIAVEQPAPATN